MDEPLPRSAENATAVAESESIELRMLTEAIYLKYGYDFRGYARASLKRRVKHNILTQQLSHISDLQHRVLHDPAAFEGLLLSLSVTVTEMFRNPEFFVALRRDVLPALSAHEHIKIWDAGCASGEEAYSLAIVLREEGLLERTQIYATDFNEVMVQRAREGILPLERMSDYTAAYQRAGGTASFADYYHARYDSAALDASLRDKVVFCHHNLATDGSFGEFDLILCRNVLIYFARELQDRVFGLFAGSLAPGGFLGLGPRESVRFTACADRFQTVSDAHRIYRQPGAVP